MAAGAIFPASDEAGMSVNLNKMEKISWSKLGDFYCPMTSWYEIDAT
jgi:hypothetical protein